MTIMNYKKFNKVSQKIAKKTGNEFWFGELGVYEQNVCKDIVAQSNIDDAVNRIINKYF